MKQMEPKKPRVLGLVLARGGSKTIPRKNLAIVANKPLMAWTVEAANESGMLERLILSTEDPEIADAGKRLGVEVPFPRPPELAGDISSSIDVNLHAVQWLEEKEGYRPDFVLLLQPTSPLRSALDIRESVELAMARQANSVVSVCPVHQHPCWMKTLDAQQRMFDLYPQSPIPTRRQDLTEVFALNGAIYLSRRDWLLATRAFVGEGTYAYVMPSERSLDIDTPWDLHLADLILRHRETYGNS
jgi:CMP-N,N'-diacetyllegionaminic acid synthase